jgi:hypothetical protein
LRRTPIEQPKHTLAKLVRRPQAVTVTLENLVQDKPAEY